MGMTDRQFDAFIDQLLSNLKEALRESPDNKRLKETISKLEASLKRP
ncbi:MAG: hypothetical protein FWH04_06745 [Oscillospiraceae bacterium]|nr:hypothetical protein [Oscillospiraceae bacterium]